MGIPLMGISIMLLYNNITFALFSLPIVLSRHANMSRVFCGHVEGIKGPQALVMLYFEYALKSTC